MPRRSNDFQHFIYLVQKQFTDRGFAVMESKELPGRTHRKREIDVAIEGTVGGHSFFVAIECRDHSRKPDVQWIEELIGKYQHVPADRVIAVSRSGFTPEAIALAKSNVAPRIDTLSLTDALQTDWKAFFSALHSVTTDLLIWEDSDEQVVVEVILPGDTDPDEAAAFEWSKINEALAISPDGQRSVLVKDLVNQVRRADALTRRVHKQMQPNSEADIGIQVRFERGSCLCVGGQSVGVEAVGFTMRAKRVRRDVPLEHGVFRHAHVAGAVSDDYLGGKAHIAFVQQRRNEMRAVISFDEHVSVDSFLDLELYGESLEHVQVVPMQLEQDAP